MSTMDAVVTAGGRIKDEFAARTGVTVKALLDVGGMPVIRRVVSALRGVPEVERIYVIGPEELRDAVVLDDGVQIVQEQECGAFNFLSGLEKCSVDGGCRAIYAASDLPFITTEALKSYLALCPDDADFCYPVASRESFLSTYPGSPVEFARLKDGFFTGGCVFLVNPAKLLENRSMIERVFNSRKSLIKMASILGWGFIWRFLTRTATVESCVKRGSELIGCECRAIMDCPAEIAYDLDDLQDYEYALGRVASASP